MTRTLALTVALLVAAIPLAGLAQAPGRTLKKQPSGKPSPVTTIDKAPVTGDKSSHLAELEAQLIEVVSVPARSAERGMDSSELCRRIVKEAGTEAYPILSRAAAAARAYSFGGGCVEALVRSALRAGGPGDEDVLSMLGNCDTGGWAGDLLAEDEELALAFFQRLLTRAVAAANKARLSDAEEWIVHSTFATLDDYTFRARCLLPELKKLANSKNPTAAEYARSLLEEMAEDTGKLAPLREAFFQVARLPADSPGRGPRIDHLCRQIVKEAGPEAYPIFARAAIELETLGGYCAQALVETGLQVGAQGDEDVLSMLGSQNTADWTASALAADRTATAAFCKRVLAKPVARAQKGKTDVFDRQTIAAVLGALTSFKGRMDSLGPELRTLAKSKDPDIAAMAQKLLGDNTKPTE